MKKGIKDRAWINQHVNDHYVQLAKHEGYRSRAVYKLIEIDKQYNLLNDVKTIVDLGCAPGSWAQYVVNKVKGQSAVIGVDLLEIEAIHNLHFICGDFTDEVVLSQMVNFLGNDMVDLILSDMAPNLSGIRMVDQAKGSYLVELVLDFARQYLRVGGDCLIKVFHGGEFNSLVKLARALFTQVIITKPKASRSKSNEIYLLCRKKVQTS